MAVASMMLPLGTPAPPFSLPDVVSGKTYSLDSFAGKAALLVIFMCRHCPYVVHVQDEIARIGQDYADSGLGIVGMSSNDPAHYPDDAPEQLKEMAQQPARRTSTSLMPNSDWPTGGSSTTVGPATTSRSQAAIFVPQSMPYLPASQSIPTKRPASAAA
jgi:thiol-disulfide isomerase/thioredoxin